MEVYFPCNTPAGPDISCNSGSSTEPLGQTHSNSRDLSASDLKKSVTQYKNIDDIEKSTSGCYHLSPKKNDTGHEVREHGPKGSDKIKLSSSASEKCFSKCATFPPLGEPKSSVDGLLGRKKEGSKTSEISEVNYVNQCYSRSMSLPNPLDLVSAMKGSREKQGTKPEKLSVTWAPDVYDPIPTSVSHVPNNNQRYQKKYGKNNKQKKGGGKSSRGKNKDKKQQPQPRKNSGSNADNKKPFNGDANGVGCFSESQVCNGDYEVGSPDPFCGTSFLKNNSVTKLHFSVAEAT